MQNINNIIFDLGGVLLNLDFSKTEAAFENLGVKNFNDYFTQSHAHPLFKQLETGKIVDNDFYDDLRKSCGIKASNQQIDAAWNAMLLDFPPERIALLQQLAGQYRLFLFSNTNAIHLHFFHQQFQQNFGFDFDTLFEKAWYSHLIGHRKPDITAFEYVLQDANLQAAQTLFIDDTMPNVTAAKQAGMQAIEVGPQKTIIDVFGKL